MVLIAVSGVYLGPDAVDHGITREEAHCQIGIQDVQDVRVKQDIADAVDVAERCTAAGELDPVDSHQRMKSCPRCSLCYDEIRQDSGTGTGGIRKPEKISRWLDKLLTDGMPWVLVCPSVEEWTCESSRLARSRTK
jgi:hypothetical protein